ncbi:ATP-binding protein [uncultured Planococcus sp.]|uniref:ATP-binding protein n=1 Tax=uncultured Planococcus sp. TaxID=337815 RepID=UPI002617A01A|nr:ATP-binding protein [uncultured Planococcus sp.]
MKLLSPSKLKSIEDIHVWLNNCAALAAKMQNNQKLKVDLRHLKWISPAGISTLAATLHKLTLQYDVRTLIPENEHSDKVIGYMERMDFFKICPPEVRVAFENSCDMTKYYKRHRNDQTNGLSELKRVKDYKEVGPLQKSIRDIMRGRISPNRVSDIASIIGELANNAIEHGESPCFPCVQYYPQQKKVEIAICDYGKGIIESLKDFVSFTSIHEVVEKAIFTEASGVEHEDRGRGLMEVQQRTFDWSRISQFYVRTHDSAYQVFPNQIQKIETGDYYFGTYFYIVIEMP